MTLNKLFTPKKIGTLEIPNRTVMTAMGCGLANEDGTLTDEFIAYYEERAKGGVGLITTEVTCVNSTHGVRAERQIYITDDSQLPMLKKLADTIHKYDTKIFVQLHHPGVFTSTAVNGNNPLVGPSGIASRILRQPAREITMDEIHELVFQFGQGARRAKEAGIDGVEIHIAHCYLLHEFLSPYFNKRTDNYGGSLENRFRIVEEIYREIRNQVGDAYPVSARISCEEYMENNEGFHLEEGIKIAQKLDDLGIDAINVSVAGGENGQSHSLEPVRYNQGWRDHLTVSIKKMVSCPVFGNSVIRDPEYAEYLLESGQMDFVGMGRSFLADPYWVAKAKSGHSEYIRKCISCLRCIDNIKSEQPIICSINPECGNETHLSPINKDGANRLVIIVGAGVGGLEAARILSQRGFKVTVIEKTAHIGGQVYLASRVPGKDKMAWFIDFEKTECEKHGVEFRLNSVISSDELLLLNPYAIIDATGSSPWKPAFISGLDNQMVLTPVDILSGSVLLEHKNVAIIGSGLTGLETAEVLVENNNMVTIIEMADSIAPGGSKVNVNDILRKLAIYNTVLIPNRKLTGIENDRIHYDDAISGESYTLPVDNVILSLGVRPVGTIFKELEGKFSNLFAIGDAKKQGRIREAVVDGYNIGVTLV